MALTLVGRIMRPSSEGGLEPIPVVTRDVSIRGVYAVCGEEFSQGQRLECILDVSGSSQTSQRDLFLHCRVRVVRVEPLVEWPTQFGVALEIEDYRVARERKPVIQSDR